ncbi:MAG: dTDP-4-dehydrorhamnose reductase [Sciscionella sp.]
MRILLIGKNGQIGWELLRSLSTLSEIIAVDRTDLDMTTEASIVRVVREVRPQLIVNAAAYTAVDQAEDEVDLAFSVNATAPAVLAKEAQQLGAGLIHYSTDYVFDGADGVPYQENASCSPLGVYGRSKLKGDQAILNSGAAYFIFRTSWVYCLRGKNFYLTVLRLAARDGRLRIVQDQIGAPTWSRIIAQATAQIIAQCFSPLAGGSDENKRRMWDRRGVYNMSAAGNTSWFGFARSICARRFPQAEVVPITSKEYKTAAQRPAYSVLCGDKLKTVFGIALPAWDESLEQIMEEGSSLKLDASAYTASGLAPVGNKT